ncbi:MAG: hypothetical protein INR71_14385, partial [Terriglobus roseus]|nr:hypothetical protein [Terriglobus roseus]
YDFTLGHLGGQSSFQRLRVEALGLDQAVQEAMAWAKNTRRLESLSSDMSNWPLVVKAGDATGGHAVGALLFEMKDVRPN